MYAKEDGYSSKEYDEDTSGSENKKALLMAVETVSKDVVSMYFRNEEEDVEMDFEELHRAYKEIKNLKKRIVKQGLQFSKDFKIKEKSEMQIIELKVQLK